MLEHMLKDIDEIYIAYGYTDFRKQTYSLANLVTSKYKGTWVVKPLPEKIEKFKKFIYEYLKINRVYVRSLGEIITRLNQMIKQ